jgi:enoyl-CoA hydratase/carnithine racemase
VGLHLNGTVPAMDHVMLTVEGRRAQLRLARPERRNALTSAMLRRLADLCGEIPEDVDVVVLGVEGDDFSVGFDLDELGDTDVTDGATEGARAVAALRDLEAVTVARLHGWVVGGGAALAAACDFRVGDPTMRVRIPEVSLGIPLGWGATPLLVAELGPALTKDLVMTGRDMGADEAFQRGFLTRLADEDHLDAEVERLVSRLLEVPRGPLRATKVQVAEAAAILRSGESDSQRLIEAVESPGFSSVFADYRSRIRRLSSS